MIYVRNHPLGTYATYAFSLATRMQSFDIVVYAMEWQFNRPQLVASAFAYVHRGTYIPSTCLEN